MPSLRGLQPLRHRGFRRLAGGQLASNVGDAFYAVALPWYVLAAHGSPVLLGTVLAAYGIPRTALLLVGGKASDRWEPWTVMMVADAVRALAVGGLAVAAASGPAAVGVLVPIAAVIGAGEGLFLPGSFSIVPSLLPDDDLQAGNAVISSGTQLATLAGPAVGGVCVALVGAPVAFGVDAVSFVGSALSLLAVRRVAAGAGHGAGVGADVRGGAGAGDPGAGGPGAGGSGAVAGGGAVPEASIRSLITSERVVVIILVVNLAANLGLGGLSEVALPALAHDAWHTGAGGYGALIAAVGGGALVGTLVAAQGRRPRRPAPVASVCFISGAACGAAVPYLGGEVGAAAALFVYGALFGFGNVLTITALQRWAPPALLGRLMSLILLTSFGAFPLSVALAGLAVHSLGAALCFPLAEAMLALACLGALTSHRWREFGIEGGGAAGGGAAGGGAAGGGGGQSRDAAPAPAAGRR